MENIEISKEDIALFPKKIAVKNLSEEEIIHLLEGKELLIKDCISKDQEEKVFKVIDTTVRAKKNKKGEFEIETQFDGDPVIDIPEVILGKKLGELELESLNRREVVGGFNYKGENFAVGIDQVDNKITVKWDKELKNLNTVNGYDLNLIDKRQLEENKRTTFKFFKSKEGQTYTARIKLTLDKKGIELHNVRFIEDKNTFRIENFLNSSKNIETDFEKDSKEIEEDQSQGKDTFAAFWPVITKVTDEVLQETANRKSQFGFDKEEQKFASNIDSKRGIYKFSFQDGRKPFAPKSFKGSNQLSPDQRRKLETGHKVFIQGVRLDKKLMNGNVYMDKKNRCFVFEMNQLVKSFSTSQSRSVSQEFER